MKYMPVLAHSLGLAYAYAWLDTIMASMPGNFKILLDFNSIGEGMFETVMLMASFGIIFYSLMMELKR